MTTIMCMEYPSCRRLIPIEVEENNFLMRVTEDDKITDFCGMLGLILSPGDGNPPTPIELVFMPCRGSNRNH